MKRFSVFDGTTMTENQLLVIEGKSALDAILKAFPNAKPELRYQYKTGTERLKGASYYYIYEYGYSEMPECSCPCVWTKPID